jgi:PPOX class probable F420-dependent enzyme
MTTTRDEPHAKLPADHIAFLSGRRLGHLVTLRPNGWPHISNVLYHVDADQPIIRISVTDDRVKVRNLRQDPRAVLHVDGPDGWTWLAAEGIAELSPVAAQPDDPTVDELAEIYRSIRGEDHPDWSEFRTAMVAEKRLVLRIHIRRTYGLLRR